MSAADEPLHHPPAPRTAALTGAVLAGGQGRRMGGADKGLQPYRGQPLAFNALQRLQPQVDACLISANRHLPTYETFGVPVVQDSIAGFAGPLAGMLAAMERCTTPWLLTVPCDVPAFPPDLAARLLQAARSAGADIAIPTVRSGPGDDDARPQPVFCLVHTRLHASLSDWLARGERRVMGWARQQGAQLVPFDQPGDPAAFANINTLEALAALNDQR